MRAESRSLGESARVGDEAEAEAGFALDPVRDAFRGDIAAKYRVEIPVSVCPRPPLGAADQSFSREPGAR